MLRDFADVFATRWLKELQQTTEKERKRSAAGAVLQEAVRERC